MKASIKKTVNKSPAKKAVAKKPMMKKGGVKKPLRKAQKGISTGTPFQQYMKTPGAVASDTSNIYNTPRSGSTLDNAFSATYGNDYKQKAIDYNSLERFRGDSSKYNEPLKKGTSLKKKGGATKTKMAMGGSTKNAKLAALAAPKNKIIRVDIITGTKKNNKKK